MEHNHDDYGIPKYHHDCLACVKLYSENEKGKPLAREFRKPRMQWGRRSRFASKGPLS